MKVNVGLFAAVGIAGALAAVGLPGRLRVAVVAGIAALPVLLMAPRGDEPTVRAYLAVALASALGVALVALDLASGAGCAIGGRALTFTAWGALTLGACMGWELVRGTRAGEPPGRDCSRPSAPSGRVLPRARTSGRARSGAPRRAWRRPRLRVGAPPRADGATIGIGRGRGWRELAGGLVLWLGVTESPPARTPRGRPAPLDRACRPARRGGLARNARPRHGRRAPDASRLSHRRHPGRLGDLPRDPGRRRGPGRRLAPHPRRARGGGGRSMRRGAA